MAPSGDRSMRFSFPGDNSAVLTAGEGPSIIVIAARFADPKATPVASKPAYKAAMDEFCCGLAPGSGADRGNLVVYISSDAVFSGRDGPYNEQDEPDPDTEYGQRHVCAEKSVADHCPNHLIVRMSYLFANDRLEEDKRLSRLRQAAMADQEFRADRGLIKSPVSVEAAARQIAVAVASGQKGVLHIVAPPVSVYDYYVCGLAKLGLPDKQHLIVSSDTERRDTSLVSHGNIN